MKGAIYTWVQKMPYLIIPIINEVFGTSYSKNEKLDQLRNEHIEKSGKIITDSIFIIQGKTYHIECQSSDDKTMAIRMIEYDFAIALDLQQKSNNDNRMYEITMPRSCVIYVRNDQNVPDSLNVKVNLPDGTHFLYQCNTLRVSDYTSDELFERNLLFLLPYYILRYENQANKFKSQPEILQHMLNDMENVRIHLLKELNSEQKSILYTDLINLIIKISNHIFRGNKEAKEGVKKIMGGKILELKSEQLMKQGFKAGKVEGRNLGKNEERTLLMKAFQELKSGKQPNELLAEGYEKETVETAIAFYRG